MSLKYLVLLGLCLVPSLGAVQARPAAVPLTQAVVQRTSDGYTYYCQKRNAWGQWCTVYVCYCKADAQRWYNNQPNNARVLAQKN